MDLKEIENFNNIRKIEEIDKDDRKEEILAKCLTINQYLNDDKINEAEAILIDIIDILDM